MDADSDPSSVAAPPPTAATREKVAWAIATLGRATRQELVGAVLAAYPNDKRGTVRDHINALTVNHPSRIYSATSAKERLADDPRYDLLYRESDKTFVPFDRETHGRWEIARDTRGALGVRRVGTDHVHTPVPRKTSTAVAEAIGSVWWVNQGGSYRLESEGGYVWAPQTTTGGYTVGHHKAVADLRPGDVVVHYANSAIRALGRVIGFPEERPRPSELSSEAWGEAGNYCRVDYFPLDEPIAIADVPDRTPAAGPFDVTGGVAQKYLITLEPHYAKRLQHQFEERWPQGSPWSEAPRRTWLFQSNPQYWDLTERLRTWSVGEPEPWLVTSYREQMNAGDRVVLWKSGKDGGILALAQLIGSPALGKRPLHLPAPTGEADAHAYLVRMELTRTLEPPISRATVSEHPILKDLAVMKFANATNFAVTDQEWAAILSLTSRPEAPPVVTETLHELTRRLYLEPAGFLGEVEELLREKGQVIFYGPPGTGKTYVARELARYLARDETRVDIVQFHPSYAYEDFIEGYRPVEKNGQMLFEPRPGPFLRMAERARNNPNDEHVILIDEINRGNIAKIFGELYFLLEYRAEQITLQYSQGLKFELPQNLWIIGTMNTADRSIALVDAALRRRFRFVGFFPDSPPVKGLLRRWLEDRQKEFLWVADVVDAANARLPQRDLQIGPSYFMSKEGLTERWVTRIWTYSVLPYIEEQFIDEPTRVKEYDLQLLRGANPVLDALDGSNTKADTTAGAASKTVLGGLADSAEADGG